MSRLKIWMGIVFVFWAVFAMAGTATAGSVGKVTGRLVDEKGSLLPGVNVVLEGTKKGATTDAEGVYVILSVDPGTYRVTASMIGYHPVTKRQVLVRVDFTTTVDFQLREEALEMEEMVVVAERPPVEPDKTGSRYVVTAEDIASAPILRNVTDFVSLEAGVATDGSGVIRSGLTADNAYIVDGIRLQNSDGQGYGVASQWSGVNVGALQEVSVITGGMNAEYGNAQAGVVQLVTRDGGASYRGEVEYRLTPAGKKHWGTDLYEAPEHRGHMQWNNPDWVAEVDPLSGRLVHQRTTYTDIRGHHFEGQLSGPLLSETSFFLSSRHNREATVLPGPWDSRPLNMRNTAKLTLPVTDQVKARVGWIFDYWKGFNSGRQHFTSPSINHVLRGPGRDIFLPAASSAGENRNRENVLYATITHTVSPKTFYELKVSLYQSKQDTAEVPTTTSTEVGTDAEGWFYTGYDDVLSYTLGEQKRLTVKLDVSSQITKGHFVKGGLEFRSYDNFYTQRGNLPGDKRKNIWYIGNPEPGTPIQPKEVAFYFQDKMEFEGFIVNAGIRYDRFWDVDVPLIGGYRTGWYRALSRFLQVPRFAMKPISNWSPRLGISHPITAKSKLHFFYGHFIQVPSFHSMFHDQWWATAAPKGGQYSEYNNTYRPSSISVGRPIWDDTQQTISFELGADWNFVTDYTVSLATFYKSGSFRETGGGSAIFNPNGRGNRSRLESISSRANTYNEDIRGLEFSLRKAFSHYTSFRAAFNLEWAEFSAGGGGNIAVSETVFPDSSFVARGGIPVWSFVNGQEQLVPLTEEQIRAVGGRANDLLRQAQSDPTGLVGGASFPGKLVQVSEQSWLSGDAKQAAEGLWMVLSHQAGDRRTRGRRSQGSLQVLFSSPSDFGPGREYIGARPLGGVGANLIYRIYSGSPFDLTRLSGKSERARGPLHTLVDLNVQKRLYFGRQVQGEIFLEVFNLFNQKDPRASQSEYYWWGLLTPSPDDGNYQTFGDLQDRTRFLDNPRESHVGLRLKF